MSVGSVPRTCGARPLVATVVLLVAAAALLVVIAVPHPARAASPSESAAPAPSAGVIVVDTGDSRSNGQGPGLVGSPFAIVIGVVLLGLIAAGGTLLYLRVADRR